MKHKQQQQKHKHSIWPLAPPSGPSAYLDFWSKSCGMNVPVLPNPAGQAHQPSLASAPRDRGPDTCSLLQLRCPEPWTSSLVMSPPWGWGATPPPHLPESIDLWPHTKPGLGAHLSTLISTLNWNPESSDDLIKSIQAKAWTSTLNPLVISWCSPATGDYWHHDACSSSNKVFEGGKLSYWSSFLSFNSYHIMDTQESVDFFICFWYKKLSTPLTPTLGYCSLLPVLTQALDHVWHVLPWPPYVQLKAALKEHKEIVCPEKK